MDQLSNGPTAIEMNNMEGTEESSHLSSTLHNAFYLSRIVAFIDVLAVWCIKIRLRTLLIFRCAIKKCILCLINLWTGERQYQLCFILVVMRFS